MRAQHAVWREQTGWAGAGEALDEAQVALAFGARAALADSALIDDLKARYPRAHILGCSTGGQIIGDDVSDVGAACLALAFDRTDVAVADAHVEDRTQSFAAGRDVGVALARPDLRALFVLSDGLSVNGSELVAGLRAGAGETVTITGGLAGDGADFGATLVHARGRTRQNAVAAVGFYGDALMVGHGSVGGWSSFGPRRAITRSQGPVLYQLDGKPALDLYKAYLGEEAEGLPGSGLLYPLRISNPADPRQAIVRTILSIDEASGSMTFAGDMPQGWSAQLMRGDFDRLAAAAEDAAANAMAPLAALSSQKAAVMISCIGRRIAMGECIVDEIHAARRAIGTAACTGFYSYGEISPHEATGMCELHNQTMTVTTFAERA